MRFSLGKALMVMFWLNFLAMLWYGILNSSFESNNFTSIFVVALILAVAFSIGTSSVAHGKE